MRRAIIHIGMPKTGTTAIQKAVSGYDDGQIAVSGLCNGTHNFPMIILFADFPLNHILAVKGGLTTANFDTLRADFDAKFEQDLARTDRSILWSSEELSVPGGSKTMAEGLINRIRPHFDRVEVVAYVRAPGPFMASSLQQRVRVGRPPD